MSFLDGEGSRISYTQNQQGFPAKQAIVNSGPLQVDNSVSVQDPAFAGHETGGYYNVLPSSYDGGRAGNENVEPSPKQWNNPATGIAQVDSQDQSSDGATGNDSQNEDASKKRRNKKRRDPEYYKKYYNRMEGGSSFENDSSTESANVGVTDNKQFTNDETYMYIPPTVPAPQSFDNVESNVAPEPSLEYIADEKDTERTSVCEQPVAAIPDTYYNQRTPFIQDSNESHYENFDESSTNEDVSKDVSELDSAKNVSNVSTGEDIPQEPTVDLQGGMDAPLSTPTVPVIHISPSESTSSSTPDGDSSGVTTPVVAEAEVTNSPAVQAPAPAGPPPVKSWASLFKAPSSGQTTNPVSTASPIVITTEEPSDESPTDNEYGSPVPTNKDPHAKRLGG